jgi:DNA polymerase III delta prime subunit
MQDLNFNDILGRQDVVKSITAILNEFNLNKHNLSFKRGIYISGAPGTGKTEFIVKLLKNLNYDVVKYDAGDIRNKSVIDAITKHNMADKNVISLMQNKQRPIAILMDEIDGMNNGDKGGINSLIRLIRPKKTKKQKLEEITYNPIICISSYHVDKKIKELMKVCHAFELKTPTPEQLQRIITAVMPDLDILLGSQILTYLNGDLRKLTAIYRLHQTHRSILRNDIIQNVFKPKSYNEDTKDITMHLLQHPVSIHEHLTIMNETDRTIVGLLWHENIIDYFAKSSNKVSVPLYGTILENICFADYIDRVTFQKQIWQFNEMSSLMKTFHTNQMFHDMLPPKKKTTAACYTPSSSAAPALRFTKVLTKYSTEYNNSLFIQSLCQQLGLDKKDMFAFFLDLRSKHPDEEIYGMFESYEIGKLDINRLYRYLDKYTNKDCKDGVDDPVIEEDPGSDQETQEIL